MAFPALPKIQMTLAVGGCALLAVACSAPASDSAPPGRPQLKTAGQPKTAGRPLPPVVGGVPLLALARHALGAAEAYAVAKPVDVKAVITTPAALDAQVPVAGGSTEPEYVVVLRGRFTCGSCGTAVMGTTTTTDPSSVPISTMVLQLPIALDDGSTTGIAVGVGAPDMARLGRVYDLDPYVTSLAGTSVPIGPLAG
jgi:hypothetical protein